MLQVEARRIVRRPPATVHAFVQDIRRYPDWVTMTGRILAVQGDGDVGTTYQERWLGTRSTWTVTERRDGALEVHEGRMLGWNVRLTLRFLPHPAGTEYVHEVGAWRRGNGANGWARPFVPLLRLLLQRSARNLRNLVEAT